MANFQDYTKAIVFLNGKQLTQETDVSIKRSTGDQPVETVALGLSGFSPGSPRCEISVGNAVPAADFEVNPGAYMTDRQIVEVSIFAAGRTLTTKGKILEDDFSHSVNSQTKLSFSFVGAYADWT